MNKILVWLGFAMPSKQTALAQAVSELEEAEREVLRQAALGEYHEAMRRMLVARIKRLRDVILDQSKEPLDA